MPSSASHGSGPVSAGPVVAVTGGPFERERGVRPARGIAAGEQHAIADALAPLLGRLPPRPGAAEREPARRARRAALRPGLPARASRAWSSLERGGAHLLGQDQQACDVAGELVRPALARRARAAPPAPLAASRAAAAPRTAHTARSRVDAHAERSRRNGSRRPRRRPARPGRGRADGRPTPRAAARPDRAAPPARPAPARTRRCACASAALRAPPPGRAVQPRGAPRVRRAPAAARARSPHCYPFARPGAPRATSVSPRACARPSQQQPPAVSPRRWRCTFAAGAQLSGVPGRHERFGDTGAAPT